MVMIREEPSMKMANIKNAQHSTSFVAKRGQISSQGGRTVTSNYGSNNRTIRSDEIQKNIREENGGSWGPIFKNKNHFISLHHC